MHDDGGPSEPRRCDDGTSVDRYGHELGVARANEAAAGTCPAGSAVDGGDSGGAIMPPPPAHPRVFDTVRLKLKTKYISGSKI